jgi:hypothetical protein
MAGFLLAWNGVGEPPPLTSGTCLSSGMRAAARE